MEHEEVSRLLKKINGFTLIELLVVISIIGLLTVFGLISFQNFNKSELLKTAAQAMKVNLRLAQNSALSGVTGGEVACSDIAMEGGLFKGYLAIFTQDKTAYSIVERCGTGVGGVIDGIKRTYALPPTDQIKVVSLDPAAAPSPTCQTSASQPVSERNLCILFGPVNQGISFIPDIVGGGTTATITLRGNSGGQIKVKVNKSGDIYETRL